MPISKPIIDEILALNEKNYCSETEDGVCVRIAAIADFPTRFGHFQIVAFFNNWDEEEHVAILNGDVHDKENVPVRLHSQCLTGDAFGSLRCDCRDQLISSLEFIAKEDEGIVIYLRQEGRGIGLLNKVKAYQLQDMGYDTVEANVALGFEDDERDYMMASHLLKCLEVRSIKLITNNPKKIDGLRKQGVDVVDRIPLLIEPNDHNKEYLRTKFEKSGHFLDELF